MKRIALFVLVMIVGAVGFELALNLLRQRSLEIQVRAEGTQPTLPQATPEGDSGSASDGAPQDPSQLGAVFLSTENALVVDVIWNYRIGPRFPKTVIRVEVQDKTGQVVAADGYTIECVQENALECSGKQSLALRFKAQDAADDRLPWQLGEYDLKVTRAYATLKPEVILTRPLVVIN